MLCCMCLAGLEMSMRDTRYSQLRSNAYASANGIVKHKRNLGISSKQLENLSNTVSERLESEKNPALQSEAQKIANAIHQ